MSGWRGSRRSSSLAMTTLIVFAAIMAGVVVGMYLAYSVMP